ncbi:MAG: hypothetical protein HFJ33_05655, partial [Clostridia bacterium]|nr:hypothetical protein [Clostridia bacterium]
MILKDIAKILLIIFCIYVFYKGIREKNKLKIVLPLIIAIIKIRMQILGIIGFVLLLLFFLTVSFLPYVIGIIISIIVIFVIRRKVAVQDRIAICIYAIVITMCISTLFEPIWFKYVSARPDDTYIKIKKINDSKKLMGLSK